MKIRVELDSSITEQELILRCSDLTPEVQQLQQALAAIVLKNQSLVFYQGDTEYYFSLEEVLFFETEDRVICAHTVNQVYQVKHRLYELEDLLPGHFIRVSKSTILNTNKVYAIRRNLTAASIVEFQNTHKQVFVSRSYYKPLKDKLEEKRSLR